MQTHLRISNADISSALRQYVDRRLRFALGRFGERVGGVSVRLARDGSAGVECRILATVQPSGRMVEVRETAPDLFAAVDRGVGRIGRTVRRDLERQREARVAHESIRAA